MAITHAVAHAQPGTHTPPEALLEYLNTQLAEAYTRDGTFVTAFYAVLNAPDRTLTYARAGHNPPRLVRGDRVLSLDEVGGLPLGLVPGQSYELARVPLEPGDLVLLYTDGIIEATSPPGPSEELFGVGRLDAVLVECRDCGAEGCLERIRAALTTFTGSAPPPDDQTLFALRVL
jgi:sigma-B regulation protein RsbU (phosphoserine phosphatase)